MQKGERQGGSSTKVTLNRTLTVCDFHDVAKFAKFYFVKCSH